jgi:hypothetical protein
MNSTKWYTLSEFVKYLGRSGQAKVEETEKGWFITLTHADDLEVRWVGAGWVGWVLVVGWALAGIYALAAAVAECAAVTHCCRSCFSSCLSLLSLTLLAHRCQRCCRRLRGRSG